MKRMYLALCATVLLGSTAEAQVKVLFENETIAIRLVAHPTDGGEPIHVMKSGGTMPAGTYKFVIAAFHGDGLKQNAIIPSGEIALNGIPLDPPEAATLKDKDVLTVKVWGWKAPWNGTKVVLRGHDVLVDFSRPWAFYALSVTSPHWKRPNSFLQLAQEGNDGLSRRLAVWTIENLKTMDAGGFRIASDPPQNIVRNGTHIALTLPIGPDRLVVPGLRDLKEEEVVATIKAGIERILEKSDPEGLPMSKHMEWAKRLEATGWLDDPTKPQPESVKEVIAEIKTAIGMKGK